MASAQDFFLAGEQQAARAAVIDILAAQGFRITEMPNGNLTIEKGSLGKTIAFGALAGKGFHVKFIVEFFTAENGGLIARIRRDLGNGMLKGGALGVSKLDNAFVQTTNALGEGLSARGLLAGVTTY